MNYPTQGRVIERLENVAIKAVDDVRKKYFRELYKQWMMTRKDLKRVLWQAYREVAPLDTWNYASAKRTGTLNRINHETKQVIERFKHNSMTHVSHALNDIYKESALHQAWILDQVTPPSYKIRLPRKRRALESGRTQIYTGADALSKWRDRWEGWLDAYHTGLNHNVGLGAINDATIDSITDEVDATKAGSPSTDIWAALQRVYMNVSQISLAFGQTDVSDENADELGTEEVWQTRYNQRVCDECDGNAGQTRDDLDDDIPAHPNCFCFGGEAPKNGRRFSQAATQANKTPRSVLTRSGRCRPRCNFWATTENQKPASSSILKSGPKIKGRTSPHELAWRFGLGRWDRLRGSLL